MLLGELVGSAVAECGSCREALLVPVAESGPTTAHLVELACDAVVMTLGGMPVDLVDTASVTSPVPEGFRRLAAAMVEGTDAAALTTLCAGLPIAERHATAYTATALLVGETRAGSRGGSAVRVHEL